MVCVNKSLSYEQTATKSYETIRIPKLVGHVVVALAATPALPSLRGLPGLLCQPNHLVLPDLTSQPSQLGQLLTEPTGCFCYSFG